MKALIRVLFSITFAVASIGLSSGCAYRFGDSDRSLPEGYETIAVPVFKNMTQETGIETYFTNAIVRELARSKVARVAKSNEAQVTLRGRLESVQYVVESPSAGAPLPQGTALTLNYRILVVSNLEVIRNSDQKVLWTTTVSGERSYAAPRIGLDGLNTANALYNQSARHQNIVLMAQDMMSEAHDRMTENF